MRIPHRMRAPFKNGVWARQGVTPRMKRRFWRLHRKLWRGQRRQRRV